MAKVKPIPKPIPTDGGSYLLDEATGEWVSTEACPMPAQSEPAVTESDHAPADA